MVENMSAVDRVVRVVIAVAIGLLYYFGYMTGGWAIALGIIAAVLVVTSAVGYCPLYALFGISTKQQTPIGR